LGAVAADGQFFALIMARHEHLPIYKAALKNNQRRRDA
jgi:hypothetical protein